MLGANCAVASGEASTSKELRTEIRSECSFGAGCALDGPLPTCLEGVFKNPWTPKDLEVSYIPAHELEQGTILVPSRKGHMSLANGCLLPARNLKDRVKFMRKEPSRPSVEKDGEEAL